jgi:hypothetical protein
MRRHWFDVHPFSRLEGDSRFREPIELWVSEGFFDRLCGIFRCHGAPVLLRRCNAVHGAGLAESIFVVFLDSDWVVLNRPRVLRPWSIAWLSSAAHVLESYRFPELAPGDRLHLRKPGF